jgi:hypothetical protein
MASLPTEIIKKIKEEREMTKTNSQLERNNVCELIYSNLVDCLTTNHQNSSRLINVPNLKYNKYVYLKDCFEKNSNLKKLKQDIHINYYLHHPLMITKENIKIEYDFSKDDVISCDTVSK